MFFSSMTSGHEDHKASVQLVRTSSHLSLEALMIMMRRARQFLTNTNYVMHVTVRQVTSSGQEDGTVIVKHLECGTSDRTYKYDP